MKSSKIILYRSEEDLADYATRSSYSRGRRYKEKEHPYRAIYQRDRDRIVHSQAFRKLEYKTQVIITHEGDYYRTRLTHTLEVAQIARTIGKYLRLNEDLIEAIALAHDLGHTPFGHAGEEILDELLKEEGGFNHNIQSLRVVDFLEMRYPEFKGLNLSWEVREGIARHSTSYDKIPASQLSQFNADNQPTLETQVVDIADEIAYDNHDLDDGLTLGLIKEAELEKITIWQIMKRPIAKRYPRISKEMLKYLIVRNLINFEVTDLIEYTAKTLARNNISTWQEVKNRKTRLARFSPEVTRLRRPLRRFLRDNLYFSRRVRRMTEKSKRFIKELFENYYANPWQIPEEFSRRMKKKESLKRIIGDYIAGMTDRSILDEYKKLFVPHERV